MKYQIGKKHHNWKGENAGYDAKHYWLKRHYGKASKCEFNTQHKSKRYEAMRERYDFRGENFIHDYGLQGVNFSSGAYTDDIIRRIARHEPKAIFIEPVYPCVPSFQERDIQGFLTFLRRLMVAIPCFQWLSHHIVKNLKDESGAEKEDPFYGNVFLKAYMTGSYYIKRNDEDGTIWKLTKASHSNLLKRIELSFDPETYISTVSSEDLPAIEKVKKYCTVAYRTHQSYTVQSVMRTLGLSRTHVLYCFRQFSKDGLHTSTKVNGKNQLQYFFKPK